jgi:putative transposase
VTLSDRHQGLDNAILLNRVAVYNRAKAQNPSRWSGDIKNWEPIKEVHFNPEKSKVEIKEDKVA